MKTKYVLAICALAICLVGMSVKPPSKEMPATIRALKVKPEVAKKLGVFSMKGVASMNARGILKPAAGNQIVYDKRRGFFLVFSNKGKYNSSKGLIVYDDLRKISVKDGSKTFPGGITLNCYGCDSCKPVNTASGPQGSNWTCAGSCKKTESCIGHVNLPGSGISEIQDQEGEWVDY